MSHIVAYLLTDQAVTQTAARYAANWPHLDAIAARDPRRTKLPPRGHDENPADRDSDPPGADQPSGRTPSIAEQTLWTTLRTAPDLGLGVGDLMRVTGMTRPTIYRHLREYVRTGHVRQVSRGLWRARPTDEPSP